MRPIIYILSLMLLFSCSAKKESARTESTSVVRPQMVIYKTKQDYSNNVPVRMNTKKTKIVGFPAPSDLKMGRELRTPIKLNKGYYFDRRGVSSNTVFTDMDYKTYTRLSKVPTVQELQNRIIDKAPFTEMYVCPNISYQTSKEELNKIVESNFKACTKVKL